MDIIDYSCRECEPNLVHYYNLELIKSIADSTYVTIVRCDVNCSNCSNYLKLYNDLDKLGFYIGQIIKSNMKWYLYIKNLNLLKICYTLENKKIYQNPIFYGMQGVSEEEFLGNIKDDMVLYSCYAENKQSDDGFYRNIVQKITNMGFEIKDVVFENHYFFSIIKKLPITKPARKNEVSKN